MNSKELEDWKDRIARFTDEYVDELNNKDTDGDISGLHRIQDELIAEIETSNREAVAVALAGQTVPSEADNGKGKP